jgi:ATP-dependent Clp protease protease subunit
MIHQGSAGFQGTAADIEVQAREILRIQKRMEEIYAFHTGRTIELIKQDLNRDFWLGAQETVEYGIADQVVGVPSAGDGLTDTPPSTNGSGSNGTSS